MNAGWDQHPYFGVNAADASWSPLLLVLPNATAGHQKTSPNSRQFTSKREHFADIPGGGAESLPRQTQDRVVRRVRERDESASVLTNTAGSISGERDR